MTDDDKKLVEQLDFDALVRQNGIGAPNGPAIEVQAARRIEALAGEVDGERARKAANAQQYKFEMEKRQQAEADLKERDAEIVRLWSALSCAVGKIEGLGGDAGYLKQMVDGCIKGGDFQPAGSCRQQKRCRDHGFCLLLDCNHTPKENSDG